MGYLQEARAERGQAANNCLLVDAVPEMTVYITHDEKGATHERRRDGKTGAPCGGGEQVDCRSAENRVPAGANADVLNAEAVIVHYGDDMFKEPY